jgi:hypothetical protein
MAMVVASILQEFTGTEAKVGWSELTPNGSRTELKLQL